MSRFLAVLGAVVAVSCVQGPEGLQAAQEEQRPPVTQPAASESAAASAGPRVFFAEQDQRFDVGGVSQWVDVPGAVVAFETKGPASTLWLQANGSISALGGSSPWIRCAFRFVIDDNPAVLNSNPLYGDLVVSPAKLETAANEWAPYFLNRRASVGPSQHSVKLQVTHAYTVYARTDGTCSADENTYSRARLMVTLQD